jgi:hypothetical protein
VGAKLTELLEWLNAEFLLELSDAYRHARLAKIDFLAGTGEV